MFGSVFDAVAVFDGEEVFFGVRNGVEGFPGVWEVRVEEFRVPSFEFRVGGVRFPVPGPQAGYRGGRRLLFP